MPRNSPISSSNFLHFWSAPFLKDIFPNRVCHLMTSNVHLVFELFGRSSDASIVSHNNTLLYLSVVSSIRNSSFSSDTAVSSKLKFYELNLVIFISKKSFTIFFHSQTGLICNHGLRTDCHRFFVDGCSKWRTCPFSVWRKSDVYGWRIVMASLIILSCVDN